MTLLQLRYISEVAKQGSFCKAAQNLYVSQPGVSKMVAALEKELGITIFVRSASGITLTAEGKRLLDAGNRLLRDADHIANQFSQTSPVRPESFCVSSLHYSFVVDAFTELLRRAESPSQHYKIKICQSSDVLQHVMDLESEVGVLSAGEHNRDYLTRVLERSGLGFHRLIRSNICAFLHESHPLAEKAALTFSDLAPYPCITYELDMDSPSILHEQFSISTFYPKRVVVVTGLYQSLEVMVRCQGYDLGNGIISPGNKRQGVVKRPVEGLDAPVSIGWVSRRGQALSAPALEFVKELDIYCRDI